jgi:hypothetical protein
MVGTSCGASCDGKPTRTRSTASPDHVHTTSRMLSQLHLARRTAVRGNRAGVVVMPPRDLDGQPPRPAAFAPFGKGDSATDHE